MSEQFKYNEARILEDALDYIETTYGGHYNSTTSAQDIQVNDLLMAIGHAKSGFICNAIEYLARYGKKDGNNIKDLYKAIHNIVLLINADFNVAGELKDLDNYIKKDFIDPWDHNLSPGCASLKDDPYTGYEVGSGEPIPSESYFEETDMLGLTLEEFKDEIFR